GKMRFVGLFFNVVGALNLLIAILLTVAIFRDRIPPSWIDKLPDAAKSEVEKQKANLPDNSYLWGFVLNTAVVGLFYLLVGTWTRSAGGEFQKIVDTQGRDISHLMSALSSLHNMYALVYMLLVVTLMMGVVALGLVLYKQFAGG